MRIRAMIKEFSNDDLRVLSSKTGKSLRELKRLRETKYYLIYTPENNAYIFFEYASYLEFYLYKSPQEFFDVIREHQLAKIL